MNSCMDELTKIVDGFKGAVAKQLHRHDEDIAGIQQGHVALGNAVTKVQENQANLHEDTEMLHQHTA